MVGNLIKRTISSIILGLVSVYIVITGGIIRQLFLGGALILMYIEWFRINNYQGLLFISGIIYMTVPMLFWIFYDSSSWHQILWIFCIVWSCDIFAYIGGKLIGGPKFAPYISPKKTWSGVIVGFICSIIISYIYIYYILDNKLLFKFTTPLLAIASILGDLFESKVKRILGVKDTGTIIPGHGGVLDRLDSFLLTSIVYLIVKIFY